MEELIPKTLIVLPCYNEEGQIAALLREIREHYPNMDTLVVDNGSTDRTYHVARALSPVVRHPINLGIGGAVQTGLKYGIDQGYKFCVQVDGDGQHPPLEIQKLILSHDIHGSNLTIGSRFIKNEGFQSTNFRRMGIFWFQHLIRILTGVTITDPTSGFRMYDHNAMHIFAQHYPTDYPEPTSIVIAHKKGLSVREVPVSMRPRLLGESSIQRFKILAYMIRVTINLIFARMRE